MSDQAITPPPASADLSAHRGARLDATHFWVQVWAHQQLNETTLFYQFRQIPWQVRRKGKSFAFTGREWRDEANCGLAEVVVSYN